MRYRKKGNKMERRGTEQEDIAYRQQIVNEYKPDVERLVRYLPWLESKMGTSVQQSYSASGIGEHSVAFPVYDSTVMSFVKEAQRTHLMDRNYMYVYSRYRIRTVQQEIKAIEKASIKEMDLLNAILSKYVMGGMTKGRMWSEAVESGIFLYVLKKMKANLDFWDKPTPTR